jgi:hypothetical protein
MSVQIASSSARRRLARRFAATSGVLSALAVSSGVLGASPAMARTYHAPNTVANFCSFNPGLGRVYVGQSQGTDYAGWRIGNTRQFNYLAIDTNGDSHVDAVVYAPFVNNQWEIVDLGLCGGPSRDRWMSPASVAASSHPGTVSYEQGIAASNEVWAEIGPTLTNSMEAEALIDAFG